MPAKHRVAIVGRTGRGDYGHGIDTVWLQVPEAEIVGVADDDKVGLAKAAERLKAPQAFADYREMLDKVKPEYVSICQRWIDQHHDMVLACAERGIHVYCEKPLCRTLAEADAMIAACERSHARLVTAHQTRYSPKLRVVQDLLAQGKIGKVVEYRGRGKEDQRGGAEDMWVLGTHIFDLIRACGGHPKWCFARITQGDRPIQASDVVEGNEGLGPLAGDGIRAMYGMPGGETAYFGSFKNGAPRGLRFALQIYGTAGIIEIQTGYLPQVKILEDPSWSPARNKSAWKDVSSAGIDAPEPLPDGKQDAGNLAAVLDLIAAVAENRQPLGSIYEARGALEMIMAVFESQRTGGPVTLPLENRDHPLNKL